LYSRALAGVDAPLVTVEVHLGNGLPAFNIVGLAEAEVREARDRVRAALSTCGFDFPARRITVNLAPADLPKESGRFDLPIALGILVASQQLPGEVLAHTEFAGELSLTGELRPVRGALAMALGAARAGRCFILPLANAAEAALAGGVRGADGTAADGVGNVEVRGAQRLLEVCEHLAGRSGLARVEGSVADADGASAWQGIPDLAEVRGQAAVKRALMVAAAGRHSLLMIGPPGSGKSMMAARFAGLLPPMQDEEALQAATVQSLGSSGFRVEHCVVARFARRITVPRLLHWWVVAVIPSPGKFRWPITACCFWMSCPSLIVACWRRCASRSKPARCRFHVPPDRRNFLRIFSCLPP
jgi:magnesium chelatase family protein